MRRRHFLPLSASPVGGLLVYSLDRTPSRVHAQEGTLRVPLKFFTEEQALDVAAAAARIFPSDESGPGATEAGVVIYIDRQLAGPYGKDRNRYSKGPWRESYPEHGYQGKENPRDTYREGIRGLGNFADLSVAEQTKKL